MFSHYYSLVSPLVHDTYFIAWLFLYKVRKEGGREEGRERRREGEEGRERREGERGLGGVPLL
jgi:hypothetical protein